ncbi:MAG: class I SAM-dependent methyltransferase [Rhodothermales bacterium]|nr:class I SAM-dependent methyltransferase [Rhodothermales bacterium]
MQYDPVKDRFGRLVEGRPRLMRLFFAALQILFLRAWYVRRALRSHLAGLKGPVRVLDAGAGFGQFSYWILRNFSGVRLHAVDVKEDYLREAEALMRSTGLDSRSTFGVDDLTRLRTTGPYDLILSVDVMEHIEEDVEVFRNFHRVLRPGGVLIVNTPSDQGGSDVHESDEESFISEHVRDGYAVDELRSKLEASGLVVESIDYTYGRWGSLAWRISIKWPMMLLNASWLFVVLLPLYYVPVLPAALILNALDVSTPVDRGTGLIAVARRA